MSAHDLLLTYSVLPYPHVRVFLFPQVNDEVYLQLVVTPVPLK